MTQKQIEQVNKDTMISDILMINPEKSPLLTEIMLEFGIHCVGCGASSFETLEQGVLGHGYSETDLNKLITDLNKALGSKEEKKETIKEESFKISLTSNALEKVKQAMKAREEEGSTLRISVVGGGCNGFMYDLQFIEKPSKADLNFKQEDVNLAVDKKSMEMLNNIEIDYVDTLNESGFKFNNPNAKADCGCGKSFG
jgi:iron-sulfur cluster assembly accessory protein